MKLLVYIFLIPLIIVFIFPILFLTLFIFSCEKLLFTLPLTFIACYITMGFSGVSIFVSIISTLLLMSIGKYLSDRYKESIFNSMKDKFNKMLPEERKMMSRQKELNKLDLDD